MNLKTVNLKPNYISLEDDVASSFYVPVMQNSRQFDRISCYFTYDAIAKYCRGIYYLGKNGGKFRLLISENISEETFDRIREGYQGSLLLDEKVRAHMRDSLSLDDTVTLSNLAYLMKCGLVEIKFAYCRNGLFHEKCGYAEDGLGNALCFTGSNNETRASLESNYEKFDVTASWLSSDFDKGRIDDTRREFESIWSGSNNHVKVFDPPESFDRYLQSFNRGTLFIDSSTFIEDSFYLDYREPHIRFTVPKSVENLSSYKFVMAIQSLVESIEDQTYVMKEGISKQTLMILMDKVRKKSESMGVEVFKSDEFNRLLQSHTSMEKLAILGLSIKQRDSSHNEYFQLFKREVSHITENDLRDEQLWDAYFAYRLRKSANFSVPGSGKTATALGMFAYLNRTENVNRLVVIGPLNCFDSWISEFSRVFGSNLPVSSITSNQMREMGNTLQYHVRLDLGRYNLVLFNYESFDHNADLTDALQQRIDDRTMLVFDEVHRIKAIKGKRATGVIPVSQNSKYTIVMTGTPIPNDYSDVYNFLHILYGEDYDDYFRLEPKELSNLEGNDALEFNKKMQPFFCRTTKGKLNVPAANEDHIITVKATAEEEALFARLHEIRMNPLTVIIRILQLESNPSMLNEALVSSLEAASFLDDFEKDSIENLETIENTYDVVTAKTKACIDLVKSLTDSGKTVIVWCIFVKSIQTITKMLEGRGVTVCNVYGGTDNRQQTIDNFKSGKYQVLITNPQTLAESVSLHKVCHDAVYFEYSYNLIHLLQSKDRIHRLGLPQGQYTQYHFLETVFDEPDQMVSLDHEIHDRLKHKEEVMLEAIENDSLEHFGTTRKEIEDLLWQIGFDRSMLK